jgi:hypothetical protein
MKIYLTAKNAKSAKLHPSPSSSPAMRGKKDEEGVRKFIKLKSWRN